MTVEQAKIKLTQFSHGAGCGCKISPAVLNEILKNNESPDNFKNLLVGNKSRDDAAVYDLGNGTALVSTTDFFMPIVDDPFEFGMIAAANAISDIYAMGGKPLLAVAILGFPVQKLPSQTAQQIISGARKICADANIPLAGGHSIDSPELIFGLAVNGLVEINHLKKNNTAQEGDMLFITKPLGVGIITTAAKRDMAKEEDLKLAVQNMSALNKIGEELGKIKGVHALTDITGFGLFGHLAEMCEGSRLSAEIYFDSIPLLTDLNFYLDKFIYPDMTTKIYSSLSDKINELSPEQFFIGCDPQTSGGLLVAVAPEYFIEFQSAVEKFNLKDAAGKPIGKMLSKKEKLMEVKN
ncbi:MAG TPA: selenide, water dikinase SelD [Bacteroidia bacterium]|nr:selenide, water dikinase SelD [Bacteroidia bacterium]